MAFAVSPTLFIEIIITVLAFIGGMAFMSFRIRRKIQKNLPKHPEYGAIQDLLYGEKNQKDEDEKKPKEVAKK